MDPNVTLARIRELRKQILDGNNDDAYAAMLADDLAELVGSLDGYISAGGFLPTEWKNAARPITASKVRG